VQIAFCPGHDPHSSPVHHHLLSKAAGESPKGKKIPEWG